MKNKLFFFTLFLILGVNCTNPQPNLLGYWETKVIHDDSSNFRFIWNTHIEELSFFSKDTIEIIDGIRGLDEIINGNWVRNSDKNFGYFTKYKLEKNSFQIFSHQNNYEYDCCTT